LGRVAARLYDHRTLAVCERVLVCVELSGNGKPAGRRDLSELSPVERHRDPFVRRVRENGSYPIALPRERHQLTVLDRKYHFIAAFAYRVRNRADEGALVVRTRYLVDIRHCSRRCGRPQTALGAKPNLPSAGGECPHRRERASVPAELHN
jgi:hypothetical protein